MTALLTDLYQLTMLDAYDAEGMDAPATFEMFVRRLPPGRAFLVAAGLEQALSYLEGLAFRPDELDWLRDRTDLSPRLLERLRALRFTGDVDAMPEGTVFFAGEPVLRVTARLSEAQFVESRLLNIVHFQTVVASKAARIVLAARGRQLVDFGMRHAHGDEAARWASRAAFLAGFDGTATVVAARDFGIPVVGTMAHSYVLAHRDEQAAFEAFGRARPQRPVLLVDTYDTDVGVGRAVDAARALAAEGIRIAGVRLDSGDLAAHARAARAMLDAAGLREAIVFASGNLDERRIAEVLALGAPIDGFGVGTALVTGGDVPSLDMVYKLVAYGGDPKRKRSEGKATLPGAKQVWRRLDAAGTMLGDTVELAQARLPGLPLLEPAMRGGRRVAPAVPLSRTHEAHAARYAALPAALRMPQPAAAPYPVSLGPGLRGLVAELDAAGR